ncbi:MAG: phosphoribosylaminoimidazolesuccinocarboxamide synthase [Planctomycetota bacterium]|nr:phosphoribosylaminoimidazolesuccinocarboxamide synthase [Planctomycetota bacterium]
MKTTALLTTSIPGHPKRSGKVRDIYDLGGNLVIVATDRISAYDVIMPNGIPDKGRVLTQISLFWFEKLAEATPNHVISSALKDLPDDFRTEELDGRFMLCKKCEAIPIECVVRGYLSGSGWVEYQKTQSVCGIVLPSGLKQSQKLPAPIFTPATKADTGHDENVSIEQAGKIVGKEIISELRDRSIALYTSAAEYAAERGVIIADTKFEWGNDKNGELTLIDEILTPDSSRFWPADEYKPGRSQPSFDKQFVRDYLDKIKFNRRPPAPVLPAEIVQKTRKKYIQAYTTLTGQSFPWA